MKPTLPESHDRGLCPVAYPQGSEYRGNMHLHRTLGHPEFVANPFVGLALGKTVENLPLPRSDGLLRFEPAEVEPFERAGTWWWLQKRGGEGCVGDFGYESVGFKCNQRSFLSDNELKRQETRGRPDDIPGSQDRRPFFRWPSGGQKYSQRRDSQLQTKVTSAQALRPLANQLQQIVNRAPMRRLARTSHWLE